MARRNQGPEDENNGVQEFDFESDLRTNKNRLDEEWLDFPYKMQRWTELAADADAAAKDAHEEVKQVRSIIILELETKANNAGEKMPTGQIIEANYRTDKRHKKAKRVLIEAERIKAQLEGTVTSMRAKRSQLENLVTLYLSGYFSAPRDPDPEYTKGLKEKAKKGTDDKMKEKIKDRDKKNRKGKED